MSNLKCNCDVQCPYYISSQGEKTNKSYITCEGIAGTQYNTLKFKSNNMRDAYMYSHCVNYPNNCQIAKVLDNQYGLLR